MLEHLVLFKLKAGATETAIEGLLDCLDGLRAIEVVRELSCGRNLSPRGQGHAVGLRVLLDDEAALQTYLDHPLHQQALTEVILPLIELVTVADYIPRA